MRFGRVAFAIATACSVAGLLAVAQEGQLATTPMATVTVPRLIRITGSVHDATGKPITGTIGVSFTLYKDRNDPSGVWQEVQTVHLDSAGRYNVLLGATSEAGLPLEIFSSDAARWLGVRPDGQAEQPRIAFLSVAYALKAADADMLGGRPASAFALADGQNSSPPGMANSAVTNLVPTALANPFGLIPATACPSLTSDGAATANQLAKFTTACNLENSAIFESGGHVGIGNKTPAGVLDVSGVTFIRGTLSSLAGSVMAPLGTATTSQSFPSSPLDMKASVYNTTLVGPANYIYRWQTEPTGNNSTNTGANLHLLFGTPGAVLETGMSIARNGVITFSPSQTFPGNGTVTSITAGSGLAGGVITKAGTVSIAAGGVTNSMITHPSITVNAGSGLSGGGTVALGGTLTLTNAAPSSGGTVTRVTAGTGLTGGGITKTGTISLNTAFTDGRYLQLTGGALSGGLAGTTAIFTGSLRASSGTFGGAVTAGGAVMPSTGTATAAQGFNSNALDMLASSFSSSQSAAAAQRFRWQAEPTGNNSSNPSAKLNLLFGSSGNSPTETGLSIASNGLVTFAPGQTFPTTGTITQIAAGSGLAGGGTHGTVTLGLMKSCSVGQTLQWNGSDWTCGNPGSVSGTTNGIAYFSGSTGLTSTSAPANGQILIGSTGNAPILRTLTAGANVSITNGPGSVTISAVGGGVTLPFFATGGERTGASLSAQTNVATLWGFLLPYNVTTTEITYDVTSADKTANDYDIGIFDSAGKLVLSIGPTAATTFAETTGFHTMPWTQGSATLAAGRYYLAVTTNCASACAAIAAASNYVSFANTVAAGATTGAALPSTLTVPADAWGAGNQPTVVIR